MFVGRDLNYLHATVTSGIDERCSLLPGAPFFSKVRFNICSIHHTS